VSVAHELTNKDSRVSVCQPFPFASSKECPVLMKAILQLSFVLFYVWSASAASQIKTVEIVQRLQHANSRNGEPSIEQRGSQSADNLPRYREAKKAPNDFQCPVVLEIDLTPTDSGISVCHDLSPALDFRRQPSHSRAPPTIA